MNRQINSSLVLDHLRRAGHLSRADLAKLTGIRATSISDIAQQLIEKKLIRETGLGVSTGGRQPVLLEINPVGLHAVGIEITEDGLNGVLVDLSEQVLASDYIPLSSTSVDVVVRHIQILVNKLCSQSSLTLNQISGLGVAVPGIISKSEDLVLFSRPLGWERVSLKEAIEEKLGDHAKIHILNNASACALEEYYSGSGIGVKSLLYFLLYLKKVRKGDMTHLGCGIVLDGRVYLGEGHMAGEIHDNVVHPLSIAHSNLGDTSLTLEELIDAGGETNATYAKVWQAWGDQLGRVISHGIDFLSPGRVVIGTDTPELEQLIGGCLHDVVREHSVAGMTVEMGLDQNDILPIQFSSLHSGSLALGAILPHLQELSLMPLLQEGVLK